MGCSSDTLFTDTTRALSFFFFYVAFSKQLFSFCTYINGELIEFISKIS